jgi:hypothetical protein
MKSGKENYAICIGAWIRMVKFWISWCRHDETRGRIEKRYRAPFPVNRKKYRDLLVFRGPFLSAFQISVYASMG